MRLVQHRGRWAIRLPDQRRLSTGLAATDDNRADAERAARAILKALEGPPETIADIWRLYMEDHGSRRIDVTRLHDAWKALTATFGHLTPEQVTRKLCREYASARKVAPGTIRRELSALGAALRWHDPSTPAVLEMPPPPPPRDRHLSRAEAQRLLDNCVAPHIKLFVRLALITGARKSAILSLTWPAVDFERGLIRLGHVQGGKGRATVPFTTASRAWLKAAQKAAETQWVIEYAGERVKNVRRGFGEACRRAKLTDVTPHVLRHTAAVWMAEAGVPMSEIAQMLGHSRTEVTESVYARYSPDHLRKAAAALDI